jgi:hypothetical protein
MARKPLSIMLSTGFLHRPHDRKIVRHEMAALSLRPLDLLSEGDPYPSELEPSPSTKLMRTADAYLAVFDTQYVMTRIRERSKLLDSELKEALNAGLPVGLLIMEPTNSAPRRVAETLALKEKELLGLPKNRRGSSFFVVTRRVPPSRNGREIYRSEIRALLRSLQRSLPQHEGPDITATLPTIPDQSPAPVLVEDRNGRIARISDRDSPLSATESDFNGWREPVLDHIQELLSGDFRQGTNHSRARDRLVALATFFAGNIAEVKERQFRVGYEIARFEGLVSAYRSGGDDMPTLSADVLEDLDRLRIALVMGVGKLERWSEFRRAASDDPLREGTASPGAIGASIDEMAVEMEARPAYFDPELPETFRFLAEATKDPLGATRTIIYGAVKSAENLVAFLGQRALGIGRNAAGAVEQHISKAVAASLVLILAGAALRISRALPTEWLWLRPLLDALAKVGRG